MFMRFAGFGALGSFAFGSFYAVASPGKSLAICCGEVGELYSERQLFCGFGEFGCGVGYVKASIAQFAFDVDFGFV